MKLSLISICLVVLSYGCSSSSPTAPTFDTTTKEDSAVITIQRWDGEDWINTNSKLALSMTWRFISYLENRDGRVEIKGGFSLDISNPTDWDVEFNFREIFFKDSNGIPIYEKSTFAYYLIRANETRNISDTFTIKLDNIDVTNQITEMSLWGSAGYPRE